MNAFVLNSLASILLAVAPVGPPSATGDRSTAAAPEDSPLTRCVEVAVGRDLQGWTCIGGTLAYREGTDGAPVTETVSEAADTAVLTEVALALRTGAAEADDYDYWCEQGTVCTRKISNYISETKGNGAYGNGSGAIGSFDVVVRTNLNGRQPQWRTWWKKDSGPAMRFSLAELRCYQNRTLLPDAGCGSWRVPDNGAFSLTGGSAYYPGWIYGGRLSESDAYYSVTDAYFVPDGYEQFVMAPLRSQDFYCFGTGNCYFPFPDDAG